MRKIMKKNKLMTTMALSMSLLLMACNDDKKQVVTTETKTVTNNVAAQVQSQSDIMSYIPADTPVLAVFSKDPNNPLPQNFVSKMKKVYGSVGDIFKMVFEEKLNSSATNVKEKEITNLIDKWMTEENFQKLGLDIEENEFALYTIDLFPVLRMTLAKTHAMDEVFDELMSKSNEHTADSAVKKEVDGYTVYQFGDKEYQIMASLKDNSMAASFVPTREVDNLMAKLLGFEKPAKSLVQSNQYQDTISQYNYLSNSLYWINIRQLADYFVNPDQHDSAMLDMLKVQDNILSADCKTEILQIFDKFPQNGRGHNCV